MIYKLFLKLTLTQKLDRFLFKILYSENNIFKWKLFFAEILKV